MDIRIDTEFHHRNPNVHIPPSCVNNPNNEFNSKFIPLTIFNNLYIGKDTVVAFADEPEIKVYNVEIVSDDKIKEHLDQPRHLVPQHHETLPHVPSNTAFICSPADVPGPHKIHFQDKKISSNMHQRFEELCEEYGQAFLKHNEDFGRIKLVKMDIDT